MRTIIYSVWNKETNTKIYSNWQECKCQEVIDNMEDKEQFEIRYKWRSF